MVGVCGMDSLLGVLLESWKVSLSYFFGSILLHSFVTFHV